MRGQSVSCSAEGSSELLWVQPEKALVRRLIQAEITVSFLRDILYRVSREEITQAMENAYQEVLLQIPDGADD